VKTSGAYTQTSGTITGPCIMTTLRLTRHSLCGSVWLLRRWHSSLHPPYSPNFTTCDFFLFLKMKLKLKGQRSDSIEEIQTESLDVMKMLMWNDFQQCFQSRKFHWDHCINAERDYSEGDEGE